MSVITLEKNILKSLATALPDGFMYFEDPRVIKNMIYATSDNFLGRPAASYENQVCIVTEPVAAALTAIQDALEARHPEYHLKIFDSYRPVAAVLDFKAWSKDPQDIKMKDIYYPSLTKSQIYENGYIAERSSHSRGSTVDLTLMKACSNGEWEEIDMGTIPDFFGEASHSDYPHLSETIKYHRRLLRELMETHGFEHYAQEWWHYTLKNEPFPDTYFDFPVR